MDRIGLLNTGPDKMQNAEAGHLRQDAAASEGLGPLFEAAQDPAGAAVTEDSLSGASKADGREDDIPGDTGMAEAARVLQHWLERWSGLSGALNEDGEVEEIASRMKIDRQEWRADASDADTAPVKAMTDDGGDADQVEPRAAAKGPPPAAVGPPSMADAALGLRSTASGADTQIVLDPIVAQSPAALAALFPAEAEMQPGLRMSGTPVSSLVQQMATTLITRADRHVEIALSPQELGRVRMLMTTDEHALRVSIWVERPEIMDLVRRNTDLLLEHFRDAGIDDAMLEFHHGDWHEDRQNPSRPAEIDTGAQPDAARIAPSETQQLLGLAGVLASDRRLDIRL